MTGRRTPVFISLLPLLIAAIFLFAPAHKNLPVFLPSKRSVPASKRSFSPSSDVGAGITHYTLQYRPSNGCAVRWLRSAIASNRCRSSGVAGPHTRSCATKPLVSLDSSGQGGAAPFGFSRQRKARPPLETSPKKQNGMCRQLMHIPFCFSEI